MEVKINNVIIAKKWLILLNIAVHIDSKQNSAYIGGRHRL